MKTQEQIDIIYSWINTLHELQRIDKPYRINNKPYSSFNLLLSPIFGAIKVYIDDYKFIIESNIHGNILSCIFNEKPYFEKSSVFVNEITRKGKEIVCVHEYDASVCVVNSYESIVCTPDISLKSIYEDNGQLQFLYNSNIMECVNCINKSKIIFDFVNKHKGRAVFCLYDIPDQEELLLDYKNILNQLQLKIKDIKPGGL